MLSVSNPKLTVRQVMKEMSLIIKVSVLRMMQFQSIANVLMVATQIQNYIELAEKPIKRPSAM